MKKIVLITNIPNNYRIPLFNELNRQLSGADMELLVIFAASGYNRRLSEVKMSDCSFRHIILHSKPIATSGDVEKTTFSYTGLLKLLKTEKPYRIIVSGFSAAAIKVYIAFVLYGFKYIIWSGSIERKAKTSVIRNYSRKFLIRNSSAAVAYGSLAKQYLIDIGADANKIAVAINTVDTAFFAATTEDLRKKISDNRIHITYIGYLVKRKKVDDLLKCIHQLSLKRNDFTMDIVGEGNERAFLEKYVMENNLEHLVVFHGFRQKDELPFFLARSAVFTFQTGFDIWGLTLTEAMAAGVPCIASPNAGAVHDLIKEGETGFIIDFSETKAVTERILWLLENKEKAKQVGQNAAEFIRRNTTLEISAGGFLKAIALSER